MLTRFMQFAVAALVASPALALQVPAPLVQADWVERNLNAVRILEIRGERENFEAAPQFVADAKSGAKRLAEVGGHLPGAAWVDFGRLRVDREIDGLKVRQMAPPKAAFEQLAQSWGVRAGDAIVIVPLGEGVGDLNEAARLYWQFKYFAEDNVAILNGGTTGWLAAGKPFATGPARPAPGNWTARGERREILADSAEAAQASSGAAQLVDARPLAQHHGLSKSGLVGQAGYIAGSKSLPTELVTRNVGPAAHYLDADTYRVLLRRLGVAASEPTVTYCNTGHQAAGAWFVLSEVLGNRSVKLYDGSMHQWTLEKRPVVGLADAR